MNERVSECIRVKYQRVSDGRERVERAAVEAVGSALLVGMAWLWTGRLNFGTAGNNCKTKPEPARLWHSIGRRLR